MFNFKLILILTDCASKHGVDGFSGTLFEQVREKGIKVTEILPGFVKTEMSISSRLDPSKMIQPEDVAEVAVFAAKESINTFFIPQSPFHFLFLIAHFFLSHTI
jgi:short-subunit dehydrogenase